MEQKNENEPLLIKNYSNFLVDLGLNFFFSQEHDLETQQVKIEKNLKCIQDVDRHVEKWQTKNDLQVILRNNNQSSKNLLLLSEKNNFIKFDQLKKIHTGLLEKMFHSIGQNLDDFIVININFTKINESHFQKIKEILKLYFTISRPKIFIDMCSDDLINFFELDRLNLKFDNFKIPSVSDIIKKQSLKKDAWLQLKLLKVRLNEF